MPAGGKALDGDVIFHGVAAHGAAYEYRLVCWEDQPRIGFRWIEGAPPGYRPCVTLDPALHPAVIRCLPSAGLQREATAFLGSAAGHCMDGRSDDPTDPYRRPEVVTAPEEQLGPWAVLLDQGPGCCAFMVGMWNGDVAFGFRWNGTRADPDGYPLARGGQPAWIRLDPGLNEAVVELLAQADSRLTTSDAAADFRTQAARNEHDVESRRTDDEASDDVRDWVFRQSF